MEHATMKYQALLLFVLLILTPTVGDANTNDEVSPASDSRFRGPPVSCPSSLATQAIRFGKALPSALGWALGNVTPWTCLPKVDPLGREAGIGRQEQALWQRANPCMTR